MAVFLRIMLVLIPVLALVLWIRWRMKRDLDAETREAEFRNLRVGMVVLLLALVATGIGLRFFDNGGGAVDQVYVPARVEDGKLIPGHYISKEEAEGEVTSDKNPESAPEENAPEESAPESGPESSKEPPQPKDGR